MTVGRGATVGRGMTVGRGTTVGRGAMVGRRNILMCSLLPSGITRNPVLPHYLCESGERLKSLEGPAKQEHVNSQGPILEETLVDQAIEQV